jgi:CBS domain containing-hemolysin-like protein
MKSLIILIVVVLLASGLCSMVEAAILSLPIIKARVLFEQKRKGSRDLLFIKENLQAAVGTIVILNNSVNIIGSIFVGQRAAGIFGNQWLGVFSAGLTFAIILVSEVIPKTIGEHYKVTVSLVSARPLRTIAWALKPLVSIVVFATSPFKRSWRLPKVTEEEIKIMLRLGRSAGTVELDEETLCNRVFKLNDLKASQMMKPISQIFALEAGLNLLQAKDAIINSPYSRIAVYEKDITNIVGICQQRQLLREIAKDNYEARVRDFMVGPIFVNEAERADGLLEKFQSWRQHLFIVRNKFGRNIGIISMEDVLEELFGEIYDEKDPLPR